MQFDDTCVGRVTLWHQCGAGPHAMIPEMQELLRTNDLVLISAVRAILAENDIQVFVADEHMSALEGSVGFLPRRVLVPREDVARSRRLLIGAGLGGELKSA